MKYGTKYKSLIQHKGCFDILEGTTYSGKTTVGFGVKLMLEIAKSDKTYHGIAGRNKGIVEKNIIKSEYGLLKVWGDYLTYNANGKGGTTIPHLVFEYGGKTKIIYVFGYDNKARWEDALGGQLGCLGVDEANIADMDFVREAAIRQNYMLWTLNPDNPHLDIYQEYINTSRPLAHYRGDYPQELLEQLNLPVVSGRTHWYFTFGDNVACSADKRAQIISNAPVGTKLYKNKILGLRGVGEGALYARYMSTDLIVAYEDIRVDSIEEVICSVDMGTATGDGDTKAHTIASVVAFTKGYRHCIVLE
ncbi:MAG: terminase, partial [Firmicutes bacterium]|nr:terminase [Bacillota bacterium]